MMLEIHLISVCGTLYNFYLSNFEASDCTLKAFKKKSKYNKNASLYTVLTENVDHLLLFLW